MIFILIMAKLAFAHGETSLGPRGGYIKMPANYHIELVDKGNELNLYLVDINYKDPKTENSSVLLKSGKSTYRCKVKSDHFICPNPKKEFKAESVRNNTKGVDVVFRFPLNKNLEKSTHHEGH